MILKDLKSQITIDQVLSKYGFDIVLKRKSDTLYGPCPLHHGNNPTAFRVNLSRGLWRCFTACGGGDIVDLVCRIENCSYAEAARILNRLLNRSYIPSKSFNPSPIDSKFKPFTYKLVLNPYVPFLQQQKKITSDMALIYDAGTTEKSLFLKNMVAVRLHDLNGNPLGYCGRRLDPPEIEKWGKWRFAKNIPKANMLFNAHRAQSFRQKGIIVVECPWAVIRFAQAGIKNVVSLLGTTLSETQIKWLSKASKVLIMLDGDAAGHMATFKIESQLKNYILTFIYQLPQGFEPEDMSDYQLKSIAEQYSFF